MKVRNEGMKGKVTSAYGGHHRHLMFNDAEGSSRG